MVQHAFMQAGNLHVVLLLLIMGVTSSCPGMVLEDWNEMGDGSRDWPGSFC